MSAGLPGDGVARVRRVTVLVTGAGIVGCHTAKRLVARGDEVVLVDITPDPRAIGSVVDPAGLRIVAGDVTQLEALQAIASEHRVDRVIHTAALMTGAARTQPQRAVAVNILGTTNILELARIRRLGRVVLASSNSIQYGVFDAFRGAHMPEDLAMRMVSQAPTNLYTTTKLAAEFIARNYRDWFGVDAVLLRYAAVLGRWGGSNNSLPARLLDALARGGEVKISDPMLVWSGIEEFVDPRDCATANLAALDAAAPQSRVYNIASGERHTFAEFVTVARSVLPGLEVRTASRPGTGFAGFPHTRPAMSDLSAAARELGWRPAHPLASTFAHFFRS